MSCECEQYLIKCIRVNVCNVGTYIGITADETGTWVGVIEFNGAWKEFGVEVTDGEEIAILTTLLNENYVHELKLYNVANELVGCYKLHTQLTQSVSGAPVPPIAAGSWDWHSFTTTVSGAVVTNTYFGGEISPIIWINQGQVAWAAAGITHDPNTASLDFTNYYNPVIPIGTLFDFQYRNLP